jgi:hypothetical protein
VKASRAIQELRALLQRKCLRLQIPSTWKFAFLPQNGSAQNALAGFWLKDNKLFGLKFSLCRAEPQFTWNSMCMPPG